MFGFIKKLKFRSGYGYTSASARSARKLARDVVRAPQAIFADGVEFGRSLERDAAREIPRKRRR